MSVVWILEWAGITPEVYDELARRTQWETDLPDGLEHQVTAFSEKALVLTQVWASPDHVLRFMEDRLLPAVNAMNIPTMPRVDQHPVRGILKPG
jgi:hypothetical protein